MLVKHFLHLLNLCLQSVYPCLHFIFNILGNLYCHYSGFFFSWTVYFLLICLIFLFFFFYHVALSAAYFSVFSFCLVDCVWSLLSSHSKVVVPCNCGVCLSWVGLSQCFVKASWIGDWFLLPDGWAWLLSFWRTVPRPVVCCGVSVGLVWLWADSLLICRAVSLFDGLMWGSWHWNLLAFGWILVLVLRWRPLGGP